MKKPTSLPKGVTLKDGTYYISKMIGGVRKTGTATTEKEALSIYARIVSELNTLNKQKTAGTIKHKVEEVDAARGMTLEKAYYRTVDLIWKGTSGEHKARINAGGVLKYFGRDTDVSKITLDWIDQWVKTLWAAGNSGSTINRKLSCLSRILRTAHERGRLATLPKMPRQKENQHRIRVVSEKEEEEMLALFKHMGFEDHWDAVIILLYTGFRPGELWRLECQDVDLKHETVTAWITKTGSPRTIPMAPKIKDVLARRLDKVNHTGKVFPGASNPWMRQGWDRVRALMGLDDDPQFIPYVLRHTCASRLARNGVTMMIIKEWMGHSTIQTTARYIHFAPKDLRGAALALG